MVQPNLPSGVTRADPQLLGVPPQQTQASLQTDSFKELINKVAWALGSTYRTPYANTRTPTRRLAVAIAKHIVTTQGYPAKIGKD